MKMNTKQPKKILWIISFAVILIASTGFLIGRNHNNVEYLEETIKRSDLQVQIVTTGTVKSENEVEVKVPIAGRIEKILIDEGQKVKKDQILFYISSAERAALLDAAKARGGNEYKEWEETYKMTPVLAPIEGTVIQIRFKPGQTFSGETTILVMSDRLTVKAKVDETDIGSVAVNQKAEIVLDAYQDETLEAQVDQIAFDAITENSVTSYVVDVLPSKTPHFMRSGMTANVTINVETKKDVISVPLNAISYKDEQSFVLIKSQKEEDKGAPVKREITVGLTEGNRVEVLSGLSEGEIILIKKFTSLDSNDESAE